jgi:hypothetical protein
VIFLGVDQKREATGFAGDNGTWITSKWFFEDYGRYAEVYVNFSFEERRGELSEKDSEYREDLIRQLAWAVRDGAPLPRTPAEDANLIESGPRFKDLRQLADSRIQMAGFDSATLGHYVIRNPKRESQLMTFDPASPADAVEVHRTSHVIGGVSCRELPDVRCATLEIHSESESFYSSNDPKFVSLVQAGKDPIPIAGPWDARHVSLPRGGLSSDGRHLVTRAPWSQGEKNWVSIFVNEISTGETTILKLAGEDLDFVQWEGESLILESGSPWDDAVPRDRYRARLDGTLQKLESVGHPTRVWDLRHELSFTIQEKKCIEISDREFRFHPDDTSMALEECCSWAGRHILNGYRPAFIDPDVLKMNFAADPSVRGGFAHLSPDNRYVLYESQQGIWFGSVEGVAPR